MEMSAPLSLYKQGTAQRNQLLEIAMPKMVIMEVLMPEPVPYGVGACCLHGQVCLRAKEPIDN